MKVHALMTSPALSVSPDTPLRDVAALLTEHGISGLPVVSHGRVVGVVSQSDIVRKERGLESPPRSFLARRTWRRERPPADARTAGEVMTSPAVVIEDWMSEYHAAWLMSTLDISRLPVVHGETLVGVISCADLVRHFGRSDAEIEEEFEAAVERYDPLEPDRLHVEVDHGLVTLDGEVEDEYDLEAVPRIASHVPGVVAVDSHLHVHA